MKTPSLWQKLTAGFKKPFRKFQKNIKSAEKQNEGYIPESIKRASMYHSKKGANKARKCNNRLQNKARTINYKTNRQ